MAQTVCPDGSQHAFGIPIVYGMSCGIVMKKEMRKLVTSQKKLKNFLEYRAKFITLIVVVLVFLVR